MCVELSPVLLSIATLFYFFPDDLLLCALGVVLFLALFLFLPFPNCSNVHIDLVKQSGL